MFSILVLCESLQHRKQKGSGYNFFFVEAILKILFLEKIVTGFFEGACFFIFVATPVNLYKFNTNHGIE